MRPLLTIFAKRPRAGEVKTRLVPPLTAAEAAELALAMLDDTVAAALALEDVECALRAAPATEQDWFRARFPRLARVDPQEGEGLGHRLAAHFAVEAARAPGRALVVIGSDAPQLGMARVREAHRRLSAGADLVLGPDQDGGYHLVGLRSSAPQLFSALPMSSAELCARTLALARNLGLAVALLAEGWDVDRPADVARLAAEAVEGSAPRTTLLARRLAPRLASGHLAAGSAPAGER